MLDITYDQKLDSEATPADDVEGKLYQFIPPDYTKTSFSFEQTVDDDASAFKPLGEKIGSYARPAASGKGKGKGKAKGKANGVTEIKEDEDGAVVFEMYKVSLSRGSGLQQTTWDTPAFREYHRRMQLFILLYIEGGSYIQVRLHRVTPLTRTGRRRRLGFCDAV